MCVSKASLTVYFEPPFWVGLYQREDGDGCRVCKVTFGREPRDQEILEWLLRNFRRLEFSPPVTGARKAASVPNPKRLLREGPEGRPAYWQGLQSPAGPPAPAGAAQGTASG